MSGTPGGRGRTVALGVGLAMALLLVAASEARAGKYAVAQCGWHLGSDAAWADTTGGAKFRPDSYCATPPGADPFDAAHLKSFTRDGQQTVSGNRFARWRWTTPPGTGIVQVRGTWWHTLHDGFEHRIGTDGGDGGFAPFAWAASTDLGQGDFAAGFSPPQWAFEDRLLCARAESKFCSLDSASWSALRALTITVEDDASPTGSIGGDITSSGWLRGPQGLQAWGADVGAGVRFGETNIDGARVALTEYPCAKAMIGGEWRATTMRPCDTAVAAAQTIATGGLSDGSHRLVHCLSDFAGNVGCLPERTIRVDNNAPAHPRSLALSGREGWRRVNDFDLVWANPDQGNASPIWGAYWRITGAAGYDTGVQFAGGRDVAMVPDRSLPASGQFTFHLWLRDEAGNDAPASAVEVPLRFDNVPPGVAFVADQDDGFPESIGAAVSDEHSGPAAGELRYRRLGDEAWTDLSARLSGGEAGRALLSARLPQSLAPGTYLFQAEAADGAGNSASSTRRADGTEMTLRKPLPIDSGRAKPEKDKEKAVKEIATRGKTRIFARLRWHQRGGTSVTVPYGATAMLSGRLLDAEGAGLAGRRIRVVARPSRGALAPAAVHTLRTGGHGGFRLELPAGPSRRITAVFRGEERLDRARRAALALRVRGGVVFHAAPTSLRTGQAVRLWGRVRTRGAPLPRRGKLVAIQYLEAATGLWRPVLVTRSDHGGHFTVRYRFRYVSGSARIRLRAVALSEERWPYVPGASRPRSVRVSG
jgi:Big-like domain-containing protein